MSEDVFWGISALGHDASLAVVRGGEILFASDSERFSRRKNDPLLSASLIAEALRFGRPKALVWHESVLRKKLRQAYAGQWDQVFRDFARPHLRDLGLGDIPFAHVDHHLGHAAAGYYTSPFDEAAVLVVDAIGEFTTLSVWDAVPGRPLRCVHRTRYPHSLGLLYSAFTQRLGLKPNEEEYILMGMAAFGRPLHADQIYDDFVARDWPFRLRQPVHCGIERDYLSDADKLDLAASIQEVTLRLLRRFFEETLRLTGRRKLVYMGGVALNCVANAVLRPMVDDLWIMPHPGDGGSSIGAVAAFLGRKLQWRGPFLGHQIESSYPYERVLETLEKRGVAAVAWGAAEFGPRALGNRSILADPRGPHMKDRVNEIKQREKFRPFAPAIIAEVANEYFSLPCPSPYMQYAVPCRFPDEFPAIVHVDGTARVQTVGPDENPQFRKLLELWRERTGCPILLNTSLNIKGEPLVNTREDADRFSKLHNVPVFS